MINSHKPLIAAMALSCLIILPATAQDKTGKACCQASSCHDQSAKDAKAAAKCRCGNGKSKCSTAAGAKSSSLPAPTPWRFAGLLERLGWTDQINRSVIISEPRVFIRPGI